MTAATDSPPPGARTSPAALRNAGPILERLRVWLPTPGRVLEIAAGWGQHAAAFASALPHLTWTPSDPSAEARASIAAWAGVAGAANLQPPVAVDATDASTWPPDPFEALVCINMIHISPWAATEGLMRLAGQVLTPGGRLILYGPYREAEVELAPSNVAFDADLRRRDPAWGLRDRDAVAAAADLHGLSLVEGVAMPANNIMLLFRAR